MKRVLVPCLWVGLVLTILFSVRSVVRDIREMAQWSADTTRVFDSVEVHRMIHDTVEAVEARHRGERDSLLAVAERNTTRRLARTREADSLRALLDSAQSAPESLSIALQTAEQYQVALGEAIAESSVLRALVRSQQLSLARLETDNKTAWSDVDSLSALLRRVPTGCTVLGVIRCPVPVVGVGVTSQGLGGFVGIAVPLGGR